MVGRHIVQAIPSAAHLSILTDLRQSLVSVVGENKALDYPIPHLTLAYNIENLPDEADLPISTLITSLEKISCQTPPFKLKGSLVKEAIPHVTISLEPTRQLEQLNQAIYNDLIHLTSNFWQEDKRIKIEHWPHATLAQNITPDSQQAALAHPTTKFGSIPEIIEFDRLTLVSKTVNPDTPYSIVETFPLTGQNH